MSKAACLERLTADSEHAITEVLGLYRRVFPDWEREPEARVRDRIRSGRYLCERAMTPQTGTVGLAIVDLLPRLGCGVLTFVAVASHWRGQGLGRHLTWAAVERFDDAGCGDWLFVEAEPGPARLYRECGFRALALEYHVPHFDHATVSQPLTLLVRPCVAAATAVPGERVAAMVEASFTEGYGLSPEDPRLAAQLQRIPQRVGFAHAELRSTQSER